MAAPVDPPVLIPTADGARIACRRRVCADGPPVLFVHGLAANALIWDMPEVRTPAYHYRSLAALLHEAGYDLWLMHLRGHGGAEGSQAPAGQADWCVDHFILYDLPAAVEHIGRESGRRPFVIAASMGALALAGHLQGARLETGPGGARIVPDADLARARQAALAGAVFCEFPAVLRWPASAYDAQGNVRWATLLRDWVGNDPAANVSFEVAARAGWLIALVGAVGYVPVTWIRGERVRATWFSRLPRGLADLAQRVERSAMEVVLQAAGTFTGATNHRVEILLRGRRYALDDMKAGVLRQLAQCVRRRAFVSALGAPEHVYSDHYHLIELPTLVVQGGRDRVANAEMTRSVFFDVIPAADKTWLFLELIAHGEIEAAPAACAEAYPQIRAWMDARRARCG